MLVKYKGFSPLAGIMLAETLPLMVGYISLLLFQSPCGDYVGGNPAT